MKRSEMLALMCKVFAENAVLVKAPRVWRHDKGMRHMMEDLLNSMESSGMEPPCLPSDQCQKLMHKYVEPNFNKWEEEEVEYEMNADGVRIKDE